MDFPIYEYARLLLFLSRSSIFSSFLSVLFLPAKNSIGRPRPEGAGQADREGKKQRTTDVNMKLASLHPSDHTDH